MNILPRLSAFSALLLATTSVHANYTVGFTPAYGTDNQSFISADTTFDLVKFTDDKTLVASGRGLYHFEKKHQGYEISGGLGLREVLDDDLAYSIDVLFDHTRTQNKLIHNEIALVGGIFQGMWGARINGYLPLQKSQASNNASPVNPRVFILAEKNIPVVEAFGAGFFMNRAIEVNVGAGFSSIATWPAIKAQYKNAFAKIGNNELSFEAFARYDFFSVHKVDENTRSRDRLYVGASIRVTMAQRSHGIRDVLIQPMDHFTRDPDAFVTVDTAIAKEALSADRLEVEAQNPLSDKVIRTQDFSHSSIQTQKSVLNKLSASSQNSYYSS